MDQRAISVIKWLGLVALVLALTALTQIGGVILIVTWLAVRVWWKRRNRPLACAVLFIVLYGGTTVWVVPPLAALGGRDALPCGLQDTAPVIPHGYLYCVLNRHYASPQVAEMLTALADDLSQQFPSIQVVYLDANFPFFDGFVLPPHLSHDDGRKIDLALYYIDPDGRPSASYSPSPIGYFGFEQSRPGDPLPCVGRNDLITLRWDMEWLQSLLPERMLHQQATAAMIRWFASNGTDFGIEKILLEPHLQRRLAVEDDLVRFQGCRAARHDDHVHIQIRP